MGIIMSNSSTTLSKQPQEVRKYMMDFSNKLASGESISSISSVSSEKLGGGATDLSITSEALTGTTGVSMIIASGSTGGRYKIEVIVTTDASQTLEGDGYLHVSD